MVKKTTQEEPGRQTKKRAQTKETFRKNNETYRTVFQMSKAAIVLSSPGGEPIDANQSLLDLLGIQSFAAFKKCKAHDFWINPRQRDDYIAILNRDGSVKDFETKLKRTDGRVIDVQCASVSIDAKPGTYIVSTIIDITKTKEAEEALRKAHEKLEREVELRTDELRKTNTRLLRHQRKLRSLASQLALAEERERRRVAKDVHDYIGQNLAFAKIRLKEWISSSSTNCSPIAEEVVQHIDSAIGDTRNLVNELGSPVLYELGLLPAVESLVRYYGDNFLNVTFENDGKPKRVSEDVKIFLYQVIRELLANVTKHARAQNCTVSLKSEKDQLRLDIIDDGVGFNSKEIEAFGYEKMGFGLFSIRERSELLGGTLEIDSKANAGTRITLCAPLVEKI